MFELIEIPARPLENLRYIWKFPVYSPPVFGHGSQQNNYDSKRYGREP